MNHSSFDFHKRTKYKTPSQDFALFEEKPSEKFDLSVFMPFQANPFSKENIKKPLYNSIGFLYDGFC